MIAQLKLFMSDLLTAYGAVLFSGRKRTGVLFLVATFLQVHHGIYGLLGAVTAHVVALLFAADRFLYPCRCIRRFRFVDGVGAIVVSDARPGALIVCSVIGCIGGIDLCPTDHLARMATRIAFAGVALCNSHMDWIIGSETFAWSYASIGKWNPRTLYPLPGRYRRLVRTTFTSGRRAISPSHRVQRPCRQATWPVSSS